jgi:hypothetical protein
MWSSFAVGGVGLGTGLVTGLLALNRQAALDRTCRSDSCPPDAESDLSDYRRLRTVSWIGYVAGFVGVAGGVVLLASQPKSDARKLSAVVSPSGLVLSGDF